MNLKRGFHRFLRVVSLVYVFTAPLYAFALVVEVSEGPTTNLNLTLKAISSAQKSLLLNAYELTSPEIQDAVLDRIQSGIHVELLQEGQPVGGLSAPAKRVQSALWQAMKDANNGDHYYEMTSHAGAHRRYRFDHAKYMVVDESSLLIGSENYSPTGNPKPNSIGNRGWEVFVHDKETSRFFSHIFVQDNDTSFSDVWDLLEQNLNSLSVLSFFTHPARGVYSARLAPARAPQGLQATSVLPITSPDTSLSGVLDLLNNAQQSIDLELMAFYPTWGKSGDRSPLLDAVLAAARRGVAVRVLLNDETVFSRGRPVKPKNTVTVDILNRAAEKESLNLSASIADLKAMHVDYIHNKGVLIDGSKTLVSSINWDENSFENNREAAVLIESEPVYEHYAHLFQKDWDVRVQ